MKIKVNGVELYYEVRGQGKPLLLVHGNGEDHHIFDKLVEVLQAYFTCYSIDSRGHGQSSAIKVYSYQAMAEDIEAFITALELEKVIYYGFSDGGIVGLLLASQYQLVDYLIISGANTNPSGLKARVMWQMKLAYLVNHDAKLKMMLEQPHINNYMLQKITAKTLVLAGCKDLIKESHTYNLAHHIIDSKLIILPNESHGSYIIGSTKLAPIIMDFVGVLPKHN